MLSINYGSLVRTIALACIAIVSPAVNFQSSLFENQLFPSVQAATVDQARDKGFAWLITHQQSDGSWRSAAGTEIVASAAAIDSLKRAGITSFPYSLGVSWLGNANAPSVDSLARQATTLKSAAGTNVSLLIAKLLQWRNTGGSWGAYDRFFTSFPDTPLATKALRTNNPSYPGSELTAPLCDILLEQKSDKSWSFLSTRNSASSPPPPTIMTSGAILPTVENIREIKEQNDLVWGPNAVITFCGGSITLNTVIDDGVNWLLTQKWKSSDGGFGDGTNSNVLQTALVYGFLKDWLPSDSKTTGALNYLLNTQNSNGSWNNDALQTAFVLKVLAIPGAGYYVDPDADGIPSAIEQYIPGMNPNIADSRFLASFPQRSAEARVTALTSPSKTAPSREAETPTNAAGLGDLSGDGVVDAADLAMVERIALGLVVPTGEQLKIADVAPAGQPDGVIDIQDVARLRRKILGLEAF